MGKDVILIYVPVLRRQPFGLPARVSGGFAPGPPPEALPLDFAKGFALWKPIFTVTSIQSVVRPWAQPRTDEILYENVCIEGTYIVV